MAITIAVEEKYLRNRHGNNLSEPALPSVAAASDQGVEAGTHGGHLFTSISQVYRFAGSSFSSTPQVPKSPFRWSQIMVIICLPA
jgi:hypothetical protein